MNRFTSFLRAFVVALAAVALMEIVRQAVFKPVLGFSPKVMPGLVAVMLAAWFGGGKAGLIAAAINVLMLWCYHGGHIHFEVLRVDRQVRLVMFFTIGVFISLLVEALQSARQRAEARQRELEAEIAEREKVEQVNQVVSSRLRGIMDNTPTVIFIKDLQGRYVTVNRRFRDLCDRSQVLGCTDSELFPAEVAARLQANDHQVRETVQAIEFEEEVPHKGHARTYVAVKFPIFDSAGRIAAIGGISTDITERKRATDALEAEQEMLRHTIQSQDHERQLIAYEIHDGLIQYVTGALMQLEAMDAAGLPERNRDTLQSVVGIMRRAVDEGRRLMEGIRTPVLDGLGVVAAIENLIDEEERAHVEVEFVKDDSLGRMDPQIEEAVYRIAQEAFTNIGKHSQASKVRIELQRTGDKVHLEVRDWGVGFTPPARINGSVHGLRGMMERARIAGGTCAIDSAPDAGTRVVVDLPYVGQEAGACAEAAAPHAAEHPGPNGNGQGGA